MVRRTSPRSRRQLPPGRRISLAFVFFLLIGLLLGGRLFHLAVVRHAAFEAQAKEQQTFRSVLEPRRGELFLQDRFGARFPAGINETFWLVYAVPKDIKDPEAVAEKLVPILSLAKPALMPRLSKPGDPFEPLARRVPLETKEKILGLGIQGIGAKEDPGRLYPNGELLAHTLGFLSYQNEEPKGQYGLEEYYEKLLRGEPGYAEGSKDTEGLAIFTSRFFRKEPKDGASLYLTIDPNIQFKTEEALKRAMEKFGPEEGTALVMETKTGKMLAMASQPAFNPNAYGETKGVKQFLNPAVSKIFEPGSVFKVITMAAAIDSGAVSSNTVYTDTGEVRIGGYTIKNSDLKAHGTMTMTNVLEKSLNTGAIFAVRKTGFEKFRSTVAAFGLGEKTGVDLAGEIAGNLSNLKRDSDIAFATASFGQGIAVTPIELLAGISAVANSGKLVKPYLVEKIVLPDGRVEEQRLEEKRQVIKTETSSTVTAMLISAVENGYGKPARIPGYFVAGKTGTAQVPSPDERGYSDKTVHTFVGWAPAYDPKFTMLISFRNPQGVRFAEGSAAPIFNEVGSFILNYYEVPPDKTK
ncbi:penicillin-binding protein 2 [Candidatus Azambacteria bacterium]|nr:penicillin-binding protein 2 [Candidatus Azambacteria bacterium]